MNNTAIAFLMTIIAGLATGIGSIIAFFAKRTNKTFLAVSLGFSAGVMIYVSMIELMSSARNTLSETFGAAGGGWITIAAFFGGIAVMFCIDKLVPSPEADSPVPLISGDRAEVDAVAAKGMRRTGIMTALAIAIHNFPEGVATFVSALAGADVAVPIVVVIAIHNIPEGIAVSVPIYAATGSKKKAFVFSVLSGLAEPVGALVGWLVLMPVMSDAALGIIYAAVAGIMVYISVDELLPSARKARSGSATTYGAMLGMAVMGVSLMLFV